MNIEQRWNTYIRIVEKAEQSHPGSLSLVKQLEQRIVECPAGVDSSTSFSEPGGLVELSLSVTSKMRAINKALEIGIDDRSIIFTGMFHSIGLVGDEERPYYIPQDSSWHLQRGIYYKYNENIPKMPVQHRSLYLIQSSGIKVSYDEWCAIATSGGFHRDESKFYLGSESKLAVLLSQARQWVLNRSE